MSKSRTFVFTNFNTEFEYKLVDDITYIAYGGEVCPKTERAHHQGWICFKTQRSGGPRSLKKICNLVGGRGHVELMRGSLGQNDAYCSKEGQLTELGDRPAQGDRNDLKDVVNDIRLGKRKADDIAVEDPVFYHMYGRTLSKAEDVLARKRFRTDMTKGIWYYGPTGVGKSHKAFEGFDPDTHYVKPLSDCWWDGYTGQKIVILNDFRGQIAYSELLTLVDKWPHSVKRRNREPIPFVAETVIVTSSMKPEDVYYNVSLRDSLEQLRRRFAITEMLPENGTAIAQKCSEGNTVTSEQNLKIDYGYL